MKNSQAKEQIIEAKAMHDHVVSDAFITTVVCQVFFSRTCFIASFFVVFIVQLFILSTNCTLAQQRNFKMSLLSCLKTRFELSKKILMISSRKVVLSKKKMKRRSYKRVLPFSLAKQCHRTSRKKKKKLLQGMRV